MGIRGLRHFIMRNHFGCFRLTKISHQKIIVDAQNIILTILGKNISHKDYNAVADRLVKLVDKLKRCRLEAVFVFDGVNSMDDEAWNTVRRRNDEKLNACLDPTKRKWPTFLLAIDIAITILRKEEANGISILQADQGADADIVAIAKELNCLILSCDADFLLCSVPGVAYCLDDKILRGLTDAENQLAVLQWHVEDFARSYSLTCRDVAIFAAVLEYFYENSQLETNFGKILSTLKWIRQMNGGTDIENDAFAKFRQLKESCDMKDFLAKFEVFHCPSSPSKYEYLTSNVASLRTFKDKVFPQPYQELWRIREFPPYLVSVLCTRKVNLPFIIDDFEMESAFVCSRDIRRISYGILLQYDDAGDAEGASKCVEFCRKEKSFTDMVIDPMLTLPNYGPIPSLDKIADMEEDARKALFLASLGTSSEVCKPFPDDIKFLIAILRHWSKNSKATLIYIRAAILGFIRSRFLLGGAESTDTYLVDTLKCSGRYLAQVGTQISQFNNDMSLECIKRAIFLHPFSQLETTVFNAQQLNRLLVSPLGDIQIQLYLSGPFIVSMTKQLQDGTKNVDELLKNSFGSGLHNFSGPLRRE